jgi:hypothetical protein
MRFSRKLIALLLIVMLALACVAEAQRAKGAEINHGKAGRLAKAKFAPKGMKGAVTADQLKSVKLKKTGGPAARKDAPKVGRVLEGKPGAGSRRPGKGQ